MRHHANTAAGDGALRVQRALAWLLLSAVGCAAADHEAAPDGGGSGDDRPPAAADGGSEVSDDGCGLPASPPAKQAFFTRNPAGDFAIEDELVRLIDGAGSGSEIRGAFAYLDEARVADALVDAADRGVDVRLVLDERNQVEQGGVSSWNPAVLRLRDALEDGLVICGGGDVPADASGGCVGRAKQHGAFLLVSATCEGAGPVVAQTSAYPTKGQVQQRNNLVVLRDDPLLHDAYRAYWSDLARQRRDDSYYRVVDGQAGTRLFLYPRAPEATRGEPAATDTVYRLLHDNVDCAAGASVQIAMAYWTGSRPALLDELVRLQKAGCAVDIVVDAARVADDVEAALVDAFAPDHLRFVAGVHHKMIVIDGRYDGSDRRLVWTGTQDFTLAALRDNDEILLRIDDDAIHRDFTRAFDQLFADGKATAP